jgi:thioredoxin 1
MALFAPHLPKQQPRPILIDRIDCIKNREILMKKITILSLIFMAMPVIVFSLLCQETTTTHKPIYLHEQKQTTRSSQDLLAPFISAGDVIIDFYADWCGPCKRMSPLIDDLAASMPEFTFLKINRDHFLELASTYKITSIPTLIFIRNGKEIGRYDGKPLTKNELAQLIVKIYKNS